MKKLFLLLSVLILISCNDEEKLITAQEDFLAAGYPPKARAKAVKPIKRLAEKGNQDAQVLYMLGTNSCQIETQNGTITLKDLRESGNAVANFLMYDILLNYNRAATSQSECWFRIRQDGIKRKSTFQWVSHAAEQNYLPAKIVLARTYFFGSELWSDGNTDSLILARDIEKSRQLLSEAVQIAKTTSLDPLQREWSKQALSQHFDEGIHPDKTKDPILRIERLRLLTLLNKNWTTTLPMVENGAQNRDEETKEQRNFREKMSLMRNIYFAKQESTEQLPFDDDAQKSIVIADELLAQVQTQIDTFYASNPTDGMRRWLDIFSEAHHQKIVKKAKENRLVFEEIKAKADTGDTDALFKLYVRYKNLPKYMDKLDEIIEKMLVQTKANGDDTVIGIIASSHSIKDKAKRIKWLRECADYPNAKCMRYLGSELIFQNKDGSYAEGILWAYKALANGELKAEKLFTKVPRHKTDGWIQDFFTNHYDIEIPNHLACQAAQFIELKQPERQNAWTDKIFPRSLFNMYERGAKYGDEDCIHRMIEHYQYQKNNKAVAKWQAKLN